ncbi:MAG: class I SAM-dependent methyltransferase [Pseudomonadota bacterium]
MSAQPVLRLRPKADARAIRHGFPWIYDNELVLDRRTRAIAPGSVAVLEDAERRPMAQVAVNTGSRIAARVLDRDCDAEIGFDWLTARLTRALAHREALYDAPFYRWVHAEADGLPGVVIDRFGSAAVLQPNAAWADARRDTLIEAIRAVAEIDTLVVNGASRARKLEGLEGDTLLALGTLDGALAVSMNGATYFADLLGGQKTGLFFDQRENHAFAQRLSRGARVLDVFAHVGGFSLAALAAGAAHAHAIDSSDAALDLAQHGASAMGQAERFETTRGDGFDTMAALAQSGARFDLVVCDPPAFAPNKSALAAGLRAYERVARLAAALAAPGGALMLCSCSHAADLTQCRAACTRGIGKAGRQGAIVYTGFAAPDHPQLPQLAESAYLKALAFRLA